MSDTRKLKKKWYARVVCKDLVAEGLGLAHIVPDFFPWPVKPLTGFILGLLPGEEAIVRVETVRSGNFHGVLAFHSELDRTLLDTFQPQHQTLAVKKISPLRIDPACKNFLNCGGCKLLHIDYDVSLEYKKRWFEAQLSREKITASHIQTIEAVKKYHYRNHVQVHINGRKERGFFAPFSYRTREFPEEGCLIFPNKITDVFFPAELELERCVRIRYDEQTEKTGFWSFNSKEDKRGRFTYSVAWPPESVTTVEIPNSAFFQVNLSMLPVWLTEIENFLRAGSSVSANEHVKILELFSGTGFISKMLSYRNLIQVKGIDLLPAAALQSVTYSNNDYGTVPILQSFNEHYFSFDLNQWEKFPAQKMKELQQFSPGVLLMNPPRGGFHRQGIEDIASQIPSIEKVIYSSCNGATLARDLASFQRTGFEIQELKLFDFFPWTSHYEILALLNRT